MSADDPRPAASPPDFSRCPEAVTTFTPILWATMSDEQRYEEYIRVRELLRRDLSNHHNALTCPYCNPKGLVMVEPASAAPAPSNDREEAIFALRTMANSDDAIGYSYRETSPETAAQYEWKARMLRLGVEALRAVSAVPPAALAGKE